MYPAHRRNRVSGTPFFAFVDVLTNRLKPVTLPLEVRSQRPMPPLAIPVVIYSWVGVGLIAEVKNSRSIVIARYTEIASIPQIDSKLHGVISQNLRPVVHQLVLVFLLNKADSCIASTFRPAPYCGPWALRIKMIGSWLVDDPTSANWKLGAPLVIGFLCSSREYQTELPDWYPGHIWWC